MYFLDISIGDNKQSVWPNLTFKLYNFLQKITICRVFVQFSFLVVNENVRKRATAIYKFKWKKKKA